MKPTTAPGLDMATEEKDVLGWEQTKEAPADDEPDAENPTTRIDHKPKLGSDERPKLANNNKKST